MAVDLGVVQVTPGDGGGLLWHGAGVPTVFSVADLNTGLKAHLSGRRIFFLKVFF